MTDAGLDARDRALGALTGLALGDALGMPTQSLSPAEIAADLALPPGAQAVAGLAAAGEHQRIAAGMPAGSVTDDTEQALLVAGLLVEGAGTIAPRALADALVSWEDRMRRRGSLDLLGPSTSRAIERVRAGVDPSEAGAGGSTNGAAMRIAPVGIATPDDDADALVDAIVGVSRVTHATSIGLAGAAAVGAAVSAGVGGADLHAAVDAGVRAARVAAGRGAWVAGGDVAERIGLALRLVGDAADDEVPAVLRDLVGTSVAAAESVPAALALAVRLGDDPWRALRVAAALGGDTDTVAAMAGAVLGAVHGAGAWPAEAVATVERVNDLALEPLVGPLLALRSRGRRASS